MAHLPWQPHPDAWLLLVMLGGGYVYALSAWGPRFAPGRIRATRGQKLMFAAALVSLEVAADWPVHQLSTSLFSIHMTQHLILSLITAPLLILGTPPWLLRRLLSPPWLHALWRRLTRPLIALLVFNGWIALYHWPVFVNQSVASDGFHLMAHVIWVVTALIMWWPVLSPLPELPHASYPVRMLYLFGQSIVPTIPASFLTFGSAVWYHAYRTTTVAYGLDPITDQQIAGLAMKIGGGFVLWIVITVLFFRWYAEEQTGAPDALYWRDIGPELERVKAAQTT